MFHPNCHSDAQRCLAASPVLSLLQSCRRTVWGSLVVALFLMIGWCNPAHAAITLSISATTLELNTYGSLQVTASGGSGSYTYAVTNGTLPAFMSLNTTTGEISGTPPNAGTYSFQVAATDALSATGVQNFSVTVSTTPPSAGVVNRTVAYNSSANAIALALSGGAATSVMVNTPPSHGTANASGTSITYTPTTGYNGPDSFTYIASNAAGASAPATVSITMTAPTMTVSPVSTTLAATAGTAFSQTFSASGGSGTYTFQATGTPPNGITFNTAQAKLSGIPTQSGSFSVSIAATDTSTGNAVTSSRTYTLNVAAPTINIAMAVGTLARGVPVNLQATASGGIGSYSYSVTSGALPTGLMLTTGTGAITGTPTTAGSYSFTVTATDDYSFTGSRGFNVSVDANAPIAVNDSVSTAANQAVSIPVTVGDGGGAITSIAIATAPSHGTAVVNGLNVLYTPAANYFGSDSFTYTDIGPGGTSAPATVSITVTALAVPTSAPQSASVQSGQSVTLHVGAAATNGPITALTIVSAPASGSAVVRGGDIVYTAAGGFGGNVQFAYTLANVFGTSAPVTATITVDNVPNAANQSATGGPGSTVQVNLMTGATGGPFTAASVVSINPTAAGTAVITNTGSGGSPSFRLSFTAAAAFAGTAAVSYTLSNASGVSAAAIVNITIAPRINPVNDVQVKAVVAAQGQTSSRFAVAQLGNFSRRLEALHGAGWARSSFGLGLTQPGAPDKPLLARWNDDEVDRVVGSPLQAGMRKVGWPLLSQVSKSDTKQSAGDNRAAADLPELPAKSGEGKQELALWIAGTLDFGQRNANGQQEGFRFTTNGVSMGADYRISDQLTLGIGTGYSRDRSDIGENGSKSIGQNVVAMGYGSVRLTPNIFIDGMFGFGVLDFDSTRYVTADGSYASGKRSGNQVFAAISGGYELRGDNWMLSPYGKLDLTSTTLAQYTEMAVGNNALTYFKQRMRTTSGTLGLRTEGQYLTRSGTWTPRVRVEYRNQFSGAQDAGISYADLASSGPAYVIRSDDRFTGNWTTGLGVKLLMQNGLAWVLDYSTNINAGQGRYSSLLFGVNVPLH